jgi:hypothetical protein
VRTGRTRGGYRQARAKFKEQNERRWLIHGLPGLARALTLAPRNFNYVE